MFIFSDKYTRFCQWKNLELNIQLTMNDFSVHRIIGRGGFGEVSWFCFVCIIFYNFAVQINIKKIIKKISLYHVFKIIYFLTFLFDVDSSL